MTWVFDIRTAILLGASLTLLIGAMLQTVSQGQPPEYRGMLRWWVGGAMAYALGYALTGFRGWIWNGWSVVLASTLITLGLGCFAVALRQFSGCPERRARLALLVAANLLISLAFALVWPDERLRHGLTHLVLILVCLACVRAIYRPGHAASPSEHVAGFYLLVALLLLCARMVSVLAFDAPVRDIFVVTPLSVLVYVFAGLLPVVGTIAFLLMCTERSQRDLQRSARLDYLTGIYNRGAIEDLASAMISSAQRHGIPLSLMVVDIDHFKRINDDLGHAAGDKALAETVQMIRGLLRSEDLIGRLGGEEFVVMMPDTDAVQGRNAAERLRGAVETTQLSIYGIERPLTVSIGVAEYRVEDAGFANLLLRADRALYAAKHAGRNRVQVDQLQVEPAL
jgi:diguanylate cyclase (GGDEF)-like protein